jgi:hypothetical protein
MNDVLVKSIEVYLLQSKLLVMDVLKFTTTHKGGFMKVDFFYIIIYNFMNYAYHPIYEPTFRKSFFHEHDHIHSFV